MQSSFDKDIGHQNSAWVIWSCQSDIMLLRKNAVMIIPRIHSSNNYHTFANILNVRARIKKRLVMQVDL